MMTPVSLLSVFCAILAAISIGKLAIADDRDSVDAGTTAVVVGIAVLLWAAVAYSVTALGTRLVLGAVGAGLVGGGVVIVVRYWDA